MTTLLFRLILLLSLILLPLSLPQPAQAQETARLYLQNVPLQDDRLLVVTIHLEDVVDLYGAEVQLQFDPAQLKTRDEDPRLDGAQIAPGPLLAFDDRFVAANKADNQTGLIDFVFTMLKPAPPIQGKGVLATITFEATGSGPFTIGVKEAKLVSASLTIIPVTTTELVIATEQSPNNAPGSESSVVWLTYRWWLMIGLLSLALGLGWWLWFHSPWTRPAVEVGNRTELRRIPGPATSPIRAATLLTEQGHQALRRGDLAQAYEYLSRAIELDPANMAAWLGKGLVARQKTEKWICFQRVLALDPSNTTAQAELRQLELR